MQFKKKTLRKQKTLQYIHSGDMVIVFFTCCIIILNLQVRTKIQQVTKIIYTTDTC